MPRHLRRPDHRLSASFNGADFMVRRAIKERSRWQRKPEAAPEFSMSRTRCDQARRCRETAAGPMSAVPEEKTLSLSIPRPESTGCHDRVSGWFGRLANQWSGGGAAKICYNTMQEALNAQGDARPFCSLPQLDCQPAWLMRCWVHY
jgi:hypothetical protein